MAGKAFSKVLDLQLMVSVGVTAGASGSHTTCSSGGWQAPLLHPAAAGSQQHVLCASHHSTLPSGACTSIVGTSNPKALTCKTLRLL